MGWLQEPSAEHYCDFPTEDFPMGDVPAPYWWCETCFAEYKVEVQPWTGWWSPCDDTGKKIRRAGEPYDTIMCHEERWVDCPPNLHYTVIKKGLFGSSINSGGTGMSHPNPGPRPEWLSGHKDGERRPISKKETPKDENVRGWRMRPR